MTSKPLAQIVEDRARHLSFRRVRFAEESALVFMLTVLMLVLAATVGLSEGSEPPETEAASVRSTPTARRADP